MSSFVELTSLENVPYVQPLNAYRSFHDYPHYHNARILSSAFDKLKFHEIEIVFLEANVRNDN